MSAAASPTHEPDQGWQRPVAASLAVTVVVTLLSYLVPAEHAASAVGLAFLGCTYFLALRDDDTDNARRFGLSLGGLLDREPLSARSLVASAGRELGFALGLAAAIFPLFWIGYAYWWSPILPFRPAPLRGLADEALGQFLVIALPEEAFYRGYLQTRLDEALPPRGTLLGTPLGLGVVLTSAIFALGHVATELSPNRLAVFFPSLLFGWIRNRRGGVGAGAAFHALCNLFASYLARSYGLGV